MSEPTAAGKPIKGPAHSMIPAAAFEPDPSVWQDCVPSTCMGPSPSRGLWRAAGSIPNQVVSPFGAGNQCNFKYSPNNLCVAERRLLTTWKLLASYARPRSCPRVLLALRSRWSAFWFDHGLRLVQVFL
ncbi:hypothetical protein GGTG_07379 [Gaeumannomyces tritici R3-111a-1]|uniref:Uncharacterized protein n=1 Tax=Gaeumannomyces tritici (strain R3-111a-1) TaxID=644352 RepID=J3P1I2_GAET3|nr:hypothetical protein GGTG_07379 [Gaeumannomyces tritici R3-111a-1]EJT77467.1 hypothetical protein GGTG_07379 [Gaeumannomyces tritici R3-111a-1]